MLDFRLKSLEIYNQIPYPIWGPDISGLDMSNIITYVRPNADESQLERCADEIKDTFDRLGIPEAEKTSLAGVGAQYDSEVVYHSIQDELVKQGVVYTDFDTALKQYEDIVRAHFMKLIPPTDHKFAALHGAVWSGGSFNVRTGRGGRVHPPARLPPSERSWGRPVQTYHDYCGKGRQGALHRRLLRS